MSPKASVVIPARNAAATLPRQLAALAQQSFDGQFEIVVVDNGSTDETAATALADDGANTVRVVSEMRAGINFARNAGVAAARAPIVLLCDADDEIHPGWVSAMVGAIDANVWAAGVLDYGTLNTDHTRLLWGAAERSKPNIADGGFTATYGCNCGFSKHMWADLGGFDTRLSGIGGDETEFFERARDAGYQQRWVSDAVVSYRLRTGLRSVMRQRFRQGRTQARMARLQGGTRIAPIVAPRPTVISLAKLLFAAPKYICPAKRRYEWLGATCRVLGRLVGWYQHQRWSPTPITPITLT